VTGAFPAFALGSAAIAVAALAFGTLLVLAAAGRLRLDLPDVLALSVPALCAYAFVLELLHIASRGRVFSDPWLVRDITVGAAVAAALVAARRRPPFGDGRTWAALAVVTVAIVGIWGSPIARIVPLAPAGTDAGTHAGWASQLIDGETTPSAPITGRIPNAYPWEFHALLATVAEITPGGRPYGALAPLQLVQTAGAAFALFALGRRVAGRRSGRPRSWLGGSATAVFGALAGGNVLALLGVATGTPRAGGPRGTYVMSSANLAPPVARDVGFVLFAAALFLLVLVAERRGDPGPAVGAGIVLGLAAITSPEFFFAGAGAAVLVLALARGLPRLRSFLAVFVPALAVVAWWAVPLAVSYARVGGFVDTTVHGAIRLAPGALALSWALVVPLGVYGVVTALRRSGTGAGRVTDPAALVPLSAAVAAMVAVLASGLIPGLLGAGFDIVGRASRSWPILELALAILAAIGLTHLLERAAAANVPLAVAVAAVVLAVEVPLPVATSIDLPRQTSRTPGLARALLGRGPNVFTALEDAGPGRCVVAAPLGLATSVFAYAGYRLVAFRGPNSAVQARRGGATAQNFARIRWKRIYSVIVPQRERLRDNAILTEGAAAPAAWRRLAARYDVDLVVTERRLASLPAFRGLRPVDTGTDRFVVLRVEACG
jgi:hypothetical protein